MTNRGVNVKITQKRKGLSMDQVWQSCYEAILSVDGVDRIDFSKITEETEIYGDGFNLDSLGLAELTGILEEKFNIDIGDEDIMEEEAYENFGTLCKFISSRIPEQ